MAFTEIYVDPSIAADSGAGTIGDPYGDLEYAIEQETFDTTNGTRVNILAGTDEVLAVELSAALADTSVSIAWAPSFAAQLVFQGYTAAAGDGGEGGISGGGSVSIIDSDNLDYTHFRDLHLHNCGSAVIVDLDDNCSITSCEVEGTTGNGIEVDAGSIVAHNYVHNIGSTAIILNSSGGVARYNRVVDNHATDDMNIGIFVFAAGCAERNIIYMNGNGQGISARLGAIVDHNSIYSATASTGAGITSAANQTPCSITNNLIEGFSGSGGVGIDLSGTNSGVIYYGGNAAFNCETEYSAHGKPAVADLGDNETLTVSPFTDAPNEDFAPVDTGNVKEGHLPATYP